METHPLTRPRVADQVFQALVRSILEGELKPGARLPTHRDLAQRFSVSPLLVRQAVHRLEELGLVRVKQGSATTVLDPAEVMDLRVVQLQLELARPSELFLRWVFEAEALSTLPLLALAELRITPAQLELLKQTIEAADPNTPDGILRFREEFWRGIAKATHNPLLQAQVHAWSQFSGKFARRPDVLEVTASFFPRLYTDLCRTLARGSGSVQLYQRTIAPILVSPRAKDSAAPAAPRRAAGSPKLVRRK